MPITPIEVITMAPKSQEASHFKQNEVQKTFAEHTQLAASYSKETKHNSQQTIKATKSENNEYRYDAKEKGNGSYSEQEKENKKKKQETDKDKEIRLSNFDIKI